MNVLKPNMQDLAIVQWKQFLQQMGHSNFPIDDQYDVSMELAIKAYQEQKKIVVDGHIGNATWLAAYQDGMLFTEEQRRAFPLPPNFRPYTSNKERFETFGMLEFTVSPVPNNPENIVILNDYETQHIVSVVIPQLQAAFPKQHSMRFHRKGVAQLLQFFEAIEQGGFLEQLLSYGGSYHPRLVRGSKTRLSNHAFGTAFDINMTWNQFHQEPALLGAQGSVREIVPLAHTFGFYWGGHFKNPDGMHFELVKIM
ncbi:M15 family metallopeptidase [Myroides sp. C15-4]|uniref:M15 family metallopeptidase n=1 Tax=Myroides sp. C15-4 TaxID=3400532 RepID=UPI003D2F8E87